MAFSLAEAYVELKAQGMSDVVGAVNQVGTALDQLSPAARMAQSALDQIGNATLGDVQSDIARLKANLGSINTDEAENELRRIMSVLDSMRTDTMDVRIDVNEEELLTAEQAATELANEIGMILPESRKARRGIDQMGEAVAKAEDKSERLVRAHREARVIVERTGVTYKQAFAQANAAMLKAEAQTDDLKRSTLELGAAARRSGRDLAASQRGVGGGMGGGGMLAGMMGGGVVAAAMGAVHTVMALGRGVVNFGQSLLSAAANAETARVKFNTLFGSVETGGKMFKQVQQFAASTPFQFDGLAQTTMLLKSFQVETNQIIPTLKVLGDIAAGSGNDMKDVGLIYGQVKAKGRLMREELLQFMERGIPLQTELAKKFGVSTAELDEMIGKGQVGFVDVANALHSLTTEGGLFANAMAKQSTTMTGLWSTFKDNVQLVAVELGNAIVDGFDLKDMIKNLTGFAQTFKTEWVPKIVSAIKFVKDAFFGGLDIGAIASDWGSFWLKVNSTWLPLAKTLITNAGRSFQAWLPTITAIMKGFGYLSMGWAKLLNMFFDNPIYDFFMDASVALGEFTGSLLGDLGNVVSNWDISWKLMQAHTTLAFANMIERVKTWGVNAIEIGQWFAENFTALHLDMANMVIAVFSNATDFIKDNWTSLLDWFIGKPIEINWGDLLKGYERQSAELPELTKPDVVETNAQIEALNRQLLSRMEREANRFKRKAATDQELESDEFNPQGEGGGIDIAAGGGADANKNPFQFYGLSQFADAMQQQAGEDMGKQRAEAIAERQAKAAEQLAQQAQGEGIKVQAPPKPAGEQPAVQIAGAFG